MESTTWLQEMLFRTRENSMSMEKYGFVTDKMDP